MSCGREGYPGVDWKQAGTTLAAETGCIPNLAHAWAERGFDLRVNAPGQSKEVAMMGALDAATPELVVSTSPTKASCDFIAFCAGWTGGMAPSPAALACPWCWCWTTALVHTSRATRAALVERPWITVEWLPRYAAELNDIERSWRDLKVPHPCGNLEKAA